MVIVEVLSKRTEDYDRGEKFAHYMRLSTLKEYVLVSQTDPRVEVYRRPDGPGHWEHEVATSGQSVTVRGKVISVDEIFGA